MRQLQPQSRRRSRLVVMLAVIVAISCISSIAAAAWRVTSQGGAGSSSATMPSGSTPSAVVNNRNVTVSWPAVTLADGSAVDGYLVFRYDAGSGASQPVTSGCSGTITGLTCTEIGIQGGDWEYSVAPLFASWSGAEGARSPAVTVAAPRFTFTGSSTINIVPGTLQVSAENYLPGQVIDLHLDSTTGPALPTTPATVTTDASGNATFSVAIAASVVDGSHDLYAVGASGDVASRNFTVDAPAPFPTSVVLLNGGPQAGRTERLDSAVITFSSALDVSTLCSTWSDSTTDQSLTAGDVVMASISDGGGGNDRFGVTLNGTDCGGAFRLGTIDLGSPDFVAELTGFSGTGNLNNISTITWDVSALTLTVKLGRRSIGANPTRVNQPFTAVYTPDAAIMGVSGRPVTGTATRTAVQF